MTGSGFPRLKDLPKRAVALRAPCARAFSLVELTAVVVIIGIAALIAQPRFAEAWARHRVRNGASLVATDIRLAQSEAIRRRSSVNVVFSADADTYAIWVYSAADSAWQPLKSLGRSTVDHVVPLGAIPDYQLAIIEADFDGVAELTFSRVGLPVMPGRISLGSGKWRIDIGVAATGRVQIGELQEVGDTPPEVNTSRPSTPPAPADKGE